MNVLLAYEDFETGKRAMRVFDFLVKALGSGYRLSNQLWKFDVLGIPKLSEAAAKDALAADIIVISCHGGADLPKHAKCWIETWREQRGNSGGLVALVDPLARQSGEICTYLRQVAKSAGLEFFAQPEEQPGEGLTKMLPGRQSPTLTDLANLSADASNVKRESGWRRWGLNE